MPKVVNALNLDLQGMGVNEARQYFLEYMQKTMFAENSKLRVIIGKGNHPNQNDKRGLSKKKLLTWLKGKHIKPLISTVVRENGAYLLTLNINSNPNEVPKTIQAHRARFTDSAAMTPLMTIIKQPIAIAQKLEDLATIIASNRNALLETTQEGNTAFMVAASDNQIAVMQFLLQREADLFIYPRLLKQENHHGESALMAAIYHGHLDTVGYLLAKAPSLLKRRDHDHHSVFDIALQADNAQQMLHYLYQHLYQHQREKGYTSLFPDYQNALQQLQAPQRNNSKKIFVNQRAQAVKKYLSWASNATKIDYFKKMTLSMRKLHTTTDIDLIIKKRSDFLEKRTSIKSIFMINNKLRKVFSRFNDTNKARTELGYKYPSTYLQYLEELQSNQPMPKVKKKKSKTKKSKTKKRILFLLTKTQMIKAVSKRKTKPVPTPSIAAIKPKNPLIEEKEPALKPSTSQKIQKLIGENPGFGGKRLFVDLVPRTCWFTNVRYAVHPADWDRLRRFVYQRAHYHCECCDTKGPIDAHERWHFNEDKKIQTLMRIIALCKPCHEATHMGLANIRGRGEAATNHLMAVTGMNNQQVHQHIKNAFLLWEKRNQHEWTLDLRIITNSGIRLARVVDKHQRKGIAEEKIAEIQKNAQQTTPISKQNTSSKQSGAKFFSNPKSTKDAPLQKATTASTKQPTNNKSKQPRG